LTVTGRFTKRILESAMQTIFAPAHDIAKKRSAFHAHANPLVFLPPGRSDDSQTKPAVANIRDDTKDSNATLGEKNRFLGTSISNVISVSYGHDFTN